ncbi:MAG: preprotein translocase subunit SecE [Verrucomicrobiota bacterium]
MNKLAQSVGNLRAFIGEVKVELLKCSWPTRKELFGQSVVVIISVIILGAFVGVCDLVNMGFLKFVIR